MVAEGVAADQFFIVIIVGRGMRARSDNRHLASQYIKELWQLVDTCLPQPRTYVRHSRIASNRLLNGRAIIKVIHGSKLEDLEFLAVEPVPRLPEERWAWRVQLDCKGENKEHRGQEHDANDGHRQVEGSLRYALRQAQRRSLKLNAYGRAEPARRSLKQHCDIFIGQERQRQRQVAQALNQITDR